MTPVVVRRQPFIHPPSLPPSLPKGISGLTVETSDGVATQHDGELRPKWCPEALPAGVVLLHLNTPIYISPARRRLAELTDARDKGVCKERDGAHRVVSNAAIQNLVDCPSQV